MFEFDEFRMKVAKMKANMRINTVAVIRACGLEFCFSAEKACEG